MALCLPATPATPPPATTPPHHHRHRLAAARLGLFVCSLQEDKCQRLEQQLRELQRVEREREQLEEVEDKDEEEVRDAVKEAEEAKRRLEDEDGRHKEALFEKMKLLAHEATQEALKRYWRLSA